MDEIELVRRMIAGDRDAFSELMEQYMRPALRAAYLISGNHADSEDIVQETFVTCYTNRTQIRSPEAFKSWFYTTLSRTAWNICRKRAKEQPVEEIYPSDAAAPGEVLEDLMVKEEEQALITAIMELPIKQRTVIVLYYYNQMTIREIAGICGCLEGTVKSRLFHAKSRLRKILEHQNHEGGTTWTLLS